MNYLEIIAVTAGIISVFLTIKQNINCWLFGLVSCICLTFFYEQIHFYGQMILQLVSIVQCIYGYINWNKIDNKNVGKIGIKKSLTLIAMCMLLGVLFTIATNTNNDNWLYLDGVGGIIALLATYLLIIKKIEAWWIFMINNITLIVLCIHQHIYAIAFLNVLLFIISISGYKEWKKNLKQA